MDIKQTAVVKLAGKPGQFVVLLSSGGVLTVQEIDASAKAIHVTERDVSGIVRPAIHAGYKQPHKMEAHELAEHISHCSQLLKALIREPS